MNWRSSRAGSFGAPCASAFMHLHSATKGPILVSFAFPREYMPETRTATPGTTGIDFVLRTFGSVSGKVVDAVTGAPVTNAEVCATAGAIATVEFYFERQFEMVRVPEATFELENVYLDEATVIARAPRYRPVFELVSQTAGEHAEEIVLKLETGLSIEGEVVTEEGSAVEGAFITLGPPMYVPPGIDKKFFAEQTAEVAKATSGADGRFTIAGLAPGPQTLSAYHPEFGSGSASASLPEQGAASPVKIVVSTGATVTGRVTLGGEPREDVTVIATVLGGLGMPFARNRTDAEGRFTLEGVRIGPASISATLPQSTGSPLGGRRLRKDVGVIAGESDVGDLEFTLATGSVSGTVTVADLPEFTGSVQCEITDGEQTESHFARLDGGSFLIENLAPGTATVQVSIMAQRPDANPMAFSARNRALETQVRAGETAQMDFVFSGIGAVAGTVLGVAPTEHGSVVAYEGELVIPEISLENEAAFGHLARGVTSVGPDGLYRIEGLDPGVYTILARATASNGPDFADKARFATSVISVAEGDSLANFDLR